MLAMSVSTMPGAPISALAEMGLHTSQPVHYQLTPSKLPEQTLQRGEGVL